MADTPRTQLERAYRLIQQERLDEASALLQPLVKKEPDNADAWWLLANAVTEPEDARTALENVLRLTPNHAEARELLDQLDATVSPVDDFGDIDFEDPFAGLDAKPATSAPTDLNTLFDDEVPSFVREGSSAAPTGANKKTIRDFTTEDDEALLAALDAPTTKSPSAGLSPRATAKPVSPFGNRRLLLPVALVALIVLLLLVVVVVLPALNPPQPTSTSVAGASTAAPSALSSTGPAATTAAVTASAIAPTAAAGVATSSAASPVAVATVSANAPSNAPSLAEVSAQAVTLLKAAGIDNAQVNVVLTSIGQTLTARFCGPYGPKLDGKVRTAMDVVAAQGARVSSQIQGIGTEVDSCTDPTQVYAREIATIQDVTAYVNKTLSATQFRSNWKTG